ncbi:MAG: hypothetical protein IT459_00105 [Planctomycetes bacterium]|nr:hypothetical protein [Planctomycetota bacterium]
MLASVALGLSLLIQVDRAFQSEIDAAIDAGVAYLRESEDSLASAPHATAYRGGTECLVFYTLLMSGVAKDDPYVARLEPIVLATARESEQTYTLALATLGLLAHDSKRHATTIAGLVARLEAGQRKGDQRGSGCYGYMLLRERTGDGTKSATKKSTQLAHWDAPSNWWDNSNTQYAILALRSAVDHGFAVDSKVFERSARHFLRQKRPDGGAAYSDSIRERSYLSMTAGVFGSLQMCVDALERTETDDAKELRASSERAIERATKWLEENLRFPPDGSNWPFYALYAVERFGHHVDSTTFGKRDWYAEGARFLVDVQLEDGAFATASLVPSRPRGALPRGRGLLGKKNRVLPNAPRAVTGDVVDTCFALLFLKRASFVHTQTSDEITILLRGVDPQARHADLDRIEHRILAVGKYAVEQLVLGLSLDNAAAFQLADRCLHDITGEDMGFTPLASADERRAIRDRWRRWLLEHPEFRSGAGS